MPRAPCLAGSRDTHGTAMSLPYIADAGSDNAHQYMIQRLPAGSRPSAPQRTGAAEPCSAPAEAGKPARWRTDHMLSLKDSYAGPPDENRLRGASGGCCCPARTHGILGIGGMPDRFGSARSLHHRRDGSRVPEVRPGLQPAGLCRVVLCPVPKGGSGTVAAGLLWHPGCVVFSVSHFAGQRQGLECVDRRDNGRPALSAAAPLVRLAARERRRSPIPEPAGDSNRSLGGDVGPAHGTSRPACHTVPLDVPRRTGAAPERLVVRLVVQPGAPDEGFRSGADAFCAAGAVVCLAPALLRQHLVLGQRCGMRGGVLSVLCPCRADRLWIFVAWPGQWTRSALFPAAGRDALLQTAP